MPCACNDSSNNAQTPGKAEREYEVRLPNGRVEIVTGEHAAKVAVTMAGGGTYSVR
jgi:hypothetical protein